MQAPASIPDVAWPLDRLGEAIVALAEASGLPTRPGTEVEAPAPGLLEEGRLEAWVEIFGASAGLDLEPVVASLGDLELLVARGGPALLGIRREEGGPVFVALLSSEGGRSLVVAPGGERAMIPSRELRNALAAPLEAPVRAELEASLDALGVPAPRRARALSRMLETRLADRVVRGSFLLGLPAGAPLRGLARAARLPRRALTFVLLQAAAALLSALGFWVLGRGALGGFSDGGWLLALGLALATQVPLVVISGLVYGGIAVDAAGILRRRLLAGALRLPEGVSRSAGTGELLGRVLESEAIGALALDAGFLAVSALIDLAVAAFVLALGPSPALSLGALGLAAALAALLSLRFYAARVRWTEARVGLTHDLVEKLVGHRTRLAQEIPERRHDGEDEALTRYLEAARPMDDALARLSAALPRAFVLFGLLALAPALASGSTSAGAVAIAVGGVLLGSGALVKLSSGLQSLAGAKIAYHVARPLLEAAATEETAPPPGLALPPRAPEPARSTESASLPAPALVEARGITFRHPGRAAPVLEGVSLTIREGDKLLVQGPSGGGKSTLASLLTGLREPSSGLLLASGLDRATLGLEGWRRRAAAAPQFHENHVFGAPFAFNLLMGRRWPPSLADLEEAEALCHELGLGPLLSRMPGGMMQMVGETGWQLSHGERSRLYLARALLQGAALVVLDESFAALDPETLRACVEVASRRARTLVVVAHP